MDKREYYLQNKEYRQAYVKSYQQTQRGKEVKRHHRLKVYGLTVDQYDEMLQEQAGRCAICGKPMMPPHIDHNHTTGQVRGLLCHRCNNGLGCFDDLAPRLVEAANYLNKSPREDHFSQNEKEEVPCRADTV